MARPSAPASKVRVSSKPVKVGSTQFAFIEGTEPLAPKAAASSDADGKRPVVRMVGGRPSRGAPGKRVKVRKLGQVSATAHVKPKTLEETLEILGANQLQVDNERGPVDQRFGRTTPAIGEQ